MKPFPLLITACLVGFVGMRSADGQISIDEAVATALRCHPQLKVARSEVAIAQARLIDAGKLENPVFEFALETQVQDGPEREGSIFMGYSQKFPVTGKLLHQRDLGVMDIKLACAEIREAERRFAAEVQEFYINAVGARAHIEVVRLLEADAGEYVKLAKAQLKLAVGSELDVGVAETEKLLVSQSRSLIECDYREALTGLRPYLGMGQNEPVTLSDSLASVTAKLRRSVTLAVPENLDRADIVAAQVRSERARVAERLACSESVEDWEIEAGYEAARSVDEPEGAERERFVGLGLKIPLPVRKKGEGMIAEARAEKKKADLELSAVNAQSRAEVAAGIEALSRSRKTAETLENRVLPLLKTREKQTRQAYEQGLVKFNEVILLQQQQSRTRETLIQAQISYAQKLADLQLALGSNPQLTKFEPCDCPTYPRGKLPKNAPFALPALRATPVVEPIVATPRNKPLKQFFNQLSKKK